MNERLRYLELLAVFQQLSEKNHFVAILTRHLAGSHVFELLEGTTLLSYVTAYWAPLNEYGKRRYAAYRAKGSVRDWIQSNRMYGADAGRSAVGPEMGCRTQNRIRLCELTVVDWIRLEILIPVPQFWWGAAVPVPGVHGSVGVQWWGSWWGDSAKFDRSLETRYA